MALEVMGQVHRDGPRLLVILPDGSRSLIPIEWTDLAAGQQLAVVVPGILGALAELLQARAIVNAFLDAFSRCGMRCRLPPWRRACVQLTLAFFDEPEPPTGPWDRIDPEARASAIEVLARVLAQAVLAATREVASDD